LSTDLEPVPTETRSRETTTKGIIMNDQNPIITPKGRAVLDLIAANPGMTVFEAINIFNALKDDVDSSFEGKS
jgi:hypothetical protein